MVSGMTTEAVGSRIEIARLTKRFGDLTAVDDLSFTVGPGRITGSSGPMLGFGFGMLVRNQWLQC